MKCYLINLDRSVARLSSFYSQIELPPSQVVRISAVDGSELSADEVAIWQRKCRVWAPMTNNEVGCFLSHRKAWMEIATAEEEWAFICEDDIHIATRFESFFASSSWIPRDATVVKAETMRHRVIVSRKIAGFAFDHCLRRLRSEHTGSAGYFISKSQAKKLLAMCVARCEPVDRFLFSPEFLDKGSYQLDPALCIQDHRLSDQESFKNFTSEIQKSEKICQRLTVIEKLSRELNRPGRQIAKFLNYYSKFIRIGYVFKHIPIEIKGKKYGTIH